MDENEITNLDVEFKRYLQILQPYLEHLINHDVIGMCKLWIQRLSNCKENEKQLRNKYIFALCYQVARGFIDDPFIRNPPDDDLPLISDDLNSEDSSTEIECLVIDSEDPTNKELFNNNKSVASDTEYLTENINQYNSEKEISRKSFNDIKTINDVKHKKENLSSALFYTCTETLIPNHYNIQENFSEKSENRAMNLIQKLRGIKAQNKVLQDELHALKQNSKNSACVINEEQRNVKLDNITSIPAYIHDNDSSTTLKSLNCKLHELQDSRKKLIDAIANLQDKLEHFEEMKKSEIDDIEANHKLEIITIKTSIREEVKKFYEKKIQELKQNYETIIKDIESKYTADTANLNTIKDDVIGEKNKEIAAMDVQMNHLKNQIEDQKIKFNVVLSKFLDNSGDDVKNYSFKYKSEQLEKRLVKLENSKAKCVKAYEAKIACLQREKQYAECTLQIHLARQRVQVVNDVTDESQIELNAALDKLENKYKDIVANVQATAIHRRMQDQITLESILHAACGIQSESCHETDNQFTVKRPNNLNQACANEISTLYSGNKVRSKLFGESAIVTGYCLNEERMGQLFDKVCIPQRDNSEPLK